MQIEPDRPMARDDRPLQVLLLEDDIDLGQAVAEHLEAQGHDVHWCKRIAQTRAAPVPDVALLDLNLPDGDALWLLRSWRAEGDRRPVIVLTAFGQVSDRVRGLQAGADDYLVKPFDLDELTARIDALRRRIEPPPRLRVGGVALDLPNDVPSATAGRSTSPPPSGRCSTAWRGARGASATAGCWARRCRATTATRSRSSSAACAKSSGRMRSRPTVASATASSAEPPRAWSLEARLRRRLWALLALLWLAGAAAAWLGVRHETAEVLDSALEETAQRLLVLPDDALGDDDGDALAAGIGSHEEHVIYQVFDERGRLRLRSHAAPPESILPPTAEGLHEAAPWRVMALTRDDGRRRVLVAEDGAHRAGLLASSGAWMVLPLLALLPLTALALHWGLRSGFRSVERAGAAMRSRAATDLRPVRLDDAPRDCTRCSTASTRCWAASAARSTRSACSPRAARTNCARRWRRHGHRRSA